MFFFSRQRKETRNQATTNGATKSQNGRKRKKGKNNKCVGIRKIKK